MNKYIASAALLCGVVSIGMTSCEDQPNKYEVTGGVPTIKFIRMQDVAAKDSLIEAASLQDGITIVGENLTSITEMWFNDVKAVLNTSYMTSNAMLVTVPKSIPDVVTDKIYMHTKNGTVVEYPFHVTVPGPVVNSMDNEWAKVGDLATITGQYFLSDPGDPLTITFTGIQNSINVVVPAENIKSITQGAVSFIVPEGAEQGQLTVHTIYGEGQSKFYFHDKRGLITDFDGSTPVVPQGWNIAASYSDVDGIDGQYVQVGPSALDAGAGWNEALKLPFWCGNWNGDPMSITDGPGIPLRNLMPAGYFDNWQNMSFKFELYIPSSNPWKSGALQVLFVNNLQCANDSWQNNTYIHTGANGGLDLGRGIYRPWATTGSFDTNDKWITVTIPLAEFVYNMDGSATGKSLTPESFDSFIMWPESGGVAGTDCEPIFRYDNLRVVPNL